MSQQYCQWERLDDSSIAQHISREAFARIDAIDQVNGMAERFFVLGKKNTRQLSLSLSVFLLGIRLKCQISNLSDRTKKKERINCNGQRLCNILFIIIIIISFNLSNASSIEWNSWHGISNLVQLEVEEEEKKTCKIEEKKIHQPCLFSLLLSLVLSF